MITVSNEFLQLMERRTDFKENAEITFLDGTVLELNEKQFSITGNRLYDSAESSSLPLGVAIRRRIQITLLNQKEQFSEYDFTAAKIRLYLTYKLSEVIEKIEYGNFVVLDPATYGTTVVITAVDDMYKFDTAFSTTLSFPVSAGILLQDICNSCGVELATLDFLNSDFSITSAPSGDLTFRKVVGYIAMLAAGNARINRFGRLEIKSYDFSALPSVLSGGTFAPWTTGDTVSGGDFATWELDTVSGGEFEWSGYHILKNFKNLKVDTDDITITGIRTIAKGSAGNEDIEFLSGTIGYVLDISNPLISGQEQRAVDLIGETLIGATFRGFAADHIAYPIAEFMDPAVVCDRKGNVYPTVLTDVAFTFFGFTTLKNSAASPVRNSSKYSSNAVQTLIQSKELIEQEKTSREVAMENLNNTLKNSSGLYSTQEEQEDGSVIYYAHNKPSIEESDFAMKFAGEAIGISLDGGKSYPYGLDMTATAILNRIYTVGLDASYINTGTIVARDANGNITFSVNLDTGETTDNALAEFKNYLGEWIRITGGTLEFGRPDDPLTLKLQNNRISFELNGVEVAWLSNNLWSVDNIVIRNSADLCGIKIRKNGRHRHIG